MGTSATLFNAGIYQLATANSTLASLLGALLTDILDNSTDVAEYPNPFKGLQQSPLPSADTIKNFQTGNFAAGEGVGGFAESTSDTLNLVDGGEDNENVPLWPLLHPARGVDVILALDASADTTFSWPNGRCVSIYFYLCAIMWEWGRTDYCEFVGGVFFG